ncbi:MAG: CPBP family intramembrane metalloprotease [Bacteroidia bacterium]|nr:CPBP family intramembrane metalloprotease [Bacteroidia bacterium]MCZ2276367.1 CPBP family intramembrane metalloprotease [Bacteroidia bacterium]
MKEGILAQLPGWRKLLIVLGLALIFTVIFYFLSVLIGTAVYGIRIPDQHSLTELDNPDVVSVLKIIQAVGAGLGTFIITSVFAAWLFGKTVFHYLQADQLFTLKQFILILLLTVIWIPFTNLIVDWNSNLNFPELLKPIETWMQTKENDAEKLTEAFVHVTTFSGLIVNIIVIALLPAIGEEFLFRGVIQRIFYDWLKNSHLAIWITASIFSAIHLQFFGFIPRLLLGGIFGYMLIWSQSIWLPIVAHFLNNTLAVITAYLTFNHKITFNPDDLGVQKDENVLVLLSAVLTASLIYLLYRSRRNFIKNPTN